MNTFVPPAGIGERGAEPAGGREPSPVAVIKQRDCHIREASREYAGGMWPRTAGVLDGSMPRGDEDVSRPTPAVLAAKLRAPRSDALPRDRLDQLLGGLWRRRLALVVAPAGSGKSTLLAHFA